jgi:hypothetical protein
MLAPGRAAADPPLTTASEVRRLSFAEAKEGRPVRLDAVVTYFDADWRLLFVQDGTNGIFVDLNGGALPHGLRQGHRVVIEGVAGPGNFAPVVARPRITIRGEGELPRERSASFADLDLGRLDSQWVGVAGVVRAAPADAGHLTLELAVGPVRVEVHVPGVGDGAVGASLVDAAVYCRGVCGSVFDARRRWQGTRLFVQSLAAVELRQAPPADPFARAPVPVESLLRFDAARDPAHRVKVAGVVTLRRDPHAFVVQDATGPVRVAADARQDLRPGDRVEVAGFPSVAGRPEAGYRASRPEAGYTPRLENAVVRVVGSGDEPAAVEMTGEAARRPEHDAYLVCVAGRVAAHEVRDGRPVVVLRADDDEFEGSFPDGAYDAAAPALAVGSRVRLTGVLSVAGAGGGPAFRVLARSARDVEILERPPWWTRERAAALLVLAAAVAAVALVWGARLRRQVRERMRHQADLEARYRGLVENASDVIFATDTAGRLTAFIRRASG